MCCSWCDALHGKVQLRLTAIWQQCFHCRTVTWVDPYTLLCRICGDPVKDGDNVTKLCDKISGGTVSGV